MGRGLRVLRLLLYPEIFGGFEVVSENGDDLLYLVVCILVNKESGVLDFLWLLLTHTKLHFDLSSP